MLLKRYAFRILVDTATTYLFLVGRTVPELCMISNAVTDWIKNAHHSHRITQWNQTILNPVPLTNCLGFVDGPVRPITRPGENQRLLYNANNGHKGVHGLKFQSAVKPDGLKLHICTIQ